MRGLIHIYTGDGKGKTTAAVGLAFRAWGRGMKVLMVQFLKGMESGEVIAAAQLGSGFTINPGRNMTKFTWEMNEEELRQAAQIQKEQLQYAIDQCSTGDWDVLILDEIMAAIYTGMVNVDEVLNFISNKPDKLELIMTGRNAPKELIEKADYVSEILEIKHPMYKGVGARSGIED